MNRARFTEHLLRRGFAVVESTATAITYTKTIPESVVKEDYPDSWGFEEAMEHEIRSQACGVSSLAECNGMSPYIKVVMTKWVITVIVSNNNE